MDNCSLFEDLGRSELEKSFVTVHADTFSEREFDKILDCLDTIRESEKKKRRSSRKRSIKNYCVRVPNVNNSRTEDDGNISYDDFDKTCDDLKSNISQMFSYFEEDVNLNLEDYESAAAKSRDNDPGTPQCFREKFLRNRNKIDESFRVQDTKPVIRGVIKKASPPTKSTNNTSLNKNQVDKIMNEFNRVKINYYSKENYVEFTNIDYFYCDNSDIESIRSENVGKLDQNVISKFDSDENVDKDKMRATMAADKSIKRKPSISFPKNSVRDKIKMFSQMNFCLKVTEQKKFFPSKIEKKMAPKSPKRPITDSNIFKNSSIAHKNQNKCYIKDINNSLRGSAQVAASAAAFVGVKPIKKICVDESSSTTLDIIEKVETFAKLNDVNLLLNLERIITKFNMSLLHTIDGLIIDGVYTSNRPKSFHIETRPSIEHFNATFIENNETFEFLVKDAELSALDDDKIQLQIRVNLSCDELSDDEQIVVVNLIFMAQYGDVETYESHQRCRIESDTSRNDDENTFCIYLISLFEVFIWFPSK